MNRFFCGDYVLPVSGPALKNAVVETTPEGKIVRVWRDMSKVPVDVHVEKYAGVIVPGFVNAHCHLELSHMRGVIPERQGLVSFIQQVMSDRTASEEAIEEAMRAADRRMQENGIVAVGDHANRSVSKAVKEASPIYYHTFVEAIGFDPAQAEKRFEAALSVADEFGDLPVSVTPHAPYSASRKLMRLIRKHLKELRDPISMHSQESEEENLFFKTKTGDFVAFYEKLGVDISFFKVQGRSSLQTVGVALPDDRPVLLVHNTFTNRKDVAFLERVGVPVYWCLCPKANRYIEGTISNIKHINLYAKPILLGTDSLASNDDLCLLSEMKAYHQHDSTVTLEEMITWVTLNGAKALGISDQYGTIEVDKTPGLNLLKNVSDLVFHPEITVQKLI